MNGGERWGMPANGLHKWRRREAESGRSLLHIDSAVAYLLLLLLIMPFALLFAHSVEQLEEWIF